MRKLRVLVLMHEDLVPPEDRSPRSGPTIVPWRTEHDILAALEELGHEARPVGVHDDLQPVDERAHRVLAGQREIAAGVEEDVDRRRDRAASAVPEDDDELHAFAEVVHGVVEARANVLAERVAAWLDAPDAIRRRLELYHAETAPVVERYRATGKLVPLHAELPIDSVYAEIQEALRLLDPAVSA